MTESTFDVPAGQISFLANLTPGLKDATYTLTISQSLSASDVTVPDREQTFTVSGPRFAIDPSDIHAQFPPPGASSQFAEVLPHIVLNKRLLPWERDVPQLDGNVPWLALLVFEDGELARDASDPKQVLANYAQTMTVGALLGTTSARVPILDADSVTDAERALTCQVITITSTTFTALLPTALELPFLSHARAVDTSGKTTSATSADDVYSIVVANRFPRQGTATAGARNVVHLVSLEGFGDLLGGTAPAAPSKSTVMLVSLASWSFSCLADPAQSFGGLARNLAFDANNDPLPAPSLALRLPVASTSGSGAVATVTERLQSGYVAAGYHAVSGEDGFAWYRGPLTPIVPSPVPRSAPFVTSSAATIYDADSGVFDHSLSAAWQCGRALALADQTFATTLMRLRQRAATKLDALASASALRGAPALAHTARFAALRAPALDSRFGNLIEQAVSALGKASKSSTLDPTPAAPRVRALPTRLLRAAAVSTELHAALAEWLPDDADAKVVAQWLGRLRLLVGVPFQYLVPDARMLPAESVRFFYLDTNWTDALTDGALQIGVGSSRDATVQSALGATLEQMGDTAALAYRNAASPALPAPLISGMLLRSALAAGWPGVAIAGTAGDKEVPLLRMEHLAPDVILCLFDGVPDTITLTEPHEGLEFGVDDDGNVETRKVINSAIQKNGAKALIFDADDSTKQYPAIRSGNKRVLNLNLNPKYATSTDVPTASTDLLSALASTLKSPINALHPGLVALQMVKGPEVVTFATSLQPSTRTKARA